MYKMRGTLGNISSTSTCVLLRRWPLGLGLIMTKKDKHLRIARRVYPSFFLSGIVEGKGEIISNYLLGEILQPGPDKLGRFRR